MELSYFVLFLKPACDLLMVRDSSQGQANNSDYTNHRDGDENLNVVNQTMVAQDSGFLLFELRLA